jgi:hypothetical protein
LGLVTIHGYPKSREPLYFAVIVLLVAAMPVGCVAAWLTAARWTARRRGLNLETAWIVGALAYLPAFVGLGLGLLAASHVLRTFAATLAAIVVAKVAVLAWPRRGSRARIAAATLGRRLFGVDSRLPSSTVVLAGCVFGWFLPMAVPLRAAPPLASGWWLWPLAFLAAWWMVAGLAARRAGDRFERAGPVAALALLPAFLMLAEPFLIDFPRARGAVLGLTIVSLGTLTAMVLAGRAPAGSEARARALVGACRIAGLVVLALAWVWEPNLPGIVVLPGDGDHLIAFLNDGLHGKLVYRDFWYPYGPLFYLLDLVSARLSGLDRYYFPAWFVTVGLGTLLLCITARMVLLTWPFQVLVSLLLFLLWPPRSVEFRVYAGYFTAVLMVAAASSRRAWALRTAGVVAGAAFLFSHESAIAALLGAQAGFLWACRQATLRETLRAYARSLWPFVTGLIGVLVPFALLAAAQGALGPYLRSTFGFVGVNDECCGLPFPDLWQELPPAPMWPSGLKNLLRLLLMSETFRYFYLPVLLYVLVALYVVGRALRGASALRQDAVLMGLAGFSLVYFRFALGRSEMAHARFATVPALVLGGALLERVALRVIRLLRARGPLDGTGLLRLAEVAVLAVGFLFLAFRLGYPTLPALVRAATHKLAHYPQARYPPGDGGGWQAVLSASGGRFYFQAAVAPTVKATLDYLRANTQPGEGVFAFPYVFRYNVLLDRPNPLTFGSCLWGAAARPADQQRLVRELAEKKPRYIVYDESEWPDMDAVPTADRFAEVADFIFTNYGLERKIAATSVLRLRELGPPVPPSVVEVARDEHRAFLQRGWYYPQEVGSVMTRWITTTATARLTRQAAQRELFVDCLIYVPPGRPARWLSASVDGREVGKVDLSTFNGWATLRFPLPEPMAAAIGVPVRLDIDQPFPAAPDPRRLGLIVSRIGFE